MTMLSWLPYTIAPAVLLVAFLTMSMRLGLRADLFLAMLDKLHAAGDREKAVKICKAVGIAPVACLARVAVDPEFDADVAPAGVPTRTPEEHEARLLEVADGQAARLTPYYWIAAIFGPVSWLALFVQPIAFDRLGQDDLETARLASMLVATVLAIAMARKAYQTRRSIYDAVPRLLKWVQPN